MTDNEFIQVLRAAAKVYSNMATDAADRIERLCDEINRQKAEIESLKEAYAVYEETTGLKQAKDEAIKEFAKRLETKLANNTDISAVGYQSIIADIDTIIKEKTEGE